MNLKIIISDILRILTDFIKFVIFIGWPFIIGTLITLYFFTFEWSVLIFLSAMVIEVFWIMFLFEYDNLF